MSAYLKTIKSKEEVITKTCDEILALVDEDQMEEDIEESTIFDVTLSKHLTEIEVFLLKHDVVKKETKPIVTENGPIDSRVKMGVRLPKIFIKTFTGEPTSWQQFHDTFLATVHKNSQLSNIEKFSYLKGYLGGEAEKCVEGITVTEENYEEALKVLKERFGNPQLTITAHMSKLLKLDKIKAGLNAKELRTLFDQIESQVRSLSTVGVLSEHYGPLLIPIVLERLPNKISLEISRALGKINWKTDDFLRVLKMEITARESCQFLKVQAEDYVDDEERHKDGSFIHES